MLSREVDSGGLQEDVSEVCVSSPSRGPLYTVSNWQSIPFIPWHRQQVCKQHYAPVTVDNR